MARADRLMAMKRALGAKPKFGAPAEGSPAEERAESPAQEKRETKAGY